MQPRHHPSRSGIAIAATAVIGSVCAVVPLVAASPSAREPISIHTGSEKGAYHANFCPPMAEALARASLDARCEPSAGSAANLSRIASRPTNFGFTQLDVLVLERGKYPPATFETVRVDDVRECIFAVVRNPELKSFGDLAARADRLRFILPPGDSGSAGTFRHLQSIDPDLARATSVRYAGDADEAIRLALAADDTVAVFVQFADPNNPRFELVERLGGAFVPVIDRNILQNSIDGRFVYFAEETEVTDANWTAKGQKLVTACTPLVLVTGKPERISDPERRAAHEAMIAAVRAVPAEALKPKDGLVSRLMKMTRELSATAVEKLVSVSEAARERTSPLLEKAKEATSKALEGAKPHVEKAKESGTATLEKAKETVKELIEPAPNAPKPADSR